MFWTYEEYDERLKSIKNSLEIVMEQLSNSRSRGVLAKAEEFPVLIKSVRTFKANSK